ncbi:tRNA preQ1(34) S-adenosylmethionine ribosyltransferase-isomerase QueA [Adhaeretor mobilis]|uniref:S-adenosylmethionine:tRNA ribosyltransferase-isomerase n=1 Tax=Adhaeretor mobilis TaxID=1930276 RepID=A0A517MVS5_9BACT|nr:tRNA preQ1(34) S-adenosylmethionine ribosyltransferase-isomerase QueA [Adhaeretor mobilis]QDS98983.1 S-adenosylmethionine:tRNA ribosyltransferase-isomerase [Adhaeretor mobilis]
MEKAWIDYELPQELIAQEPAQKRVDARLMVIDRQRESIEHFYVRDLPELLSTGDRLVFNDTKVIPAQLRGIRVGTGGRWQGLFLGETAEGDWRLVCKTRGRLNEPEPVMLLDRDGRETAKLWLVERTGNGQWLARPDEKVPTEELLAKVGQVPLPPYIRGGRMVDDDVLRYQTVFARHPGAVAAPTAGLHFTTDLLKALAQTGVRTSAVTLHVGMGTFRPIAVDDPAEHDMHSEWGDLSQPAAEELNITRAEGGRIISVGTTSTRVLESAAIAQDITAGQSIESWQGETSLYIRPPYEYRLVDALLTNFHFPRTTLLLLVQAFGGTGLIREAYERAIVEEYRFYSYGDAMLIV